MYELSDVISVWDELMNPKSVICCEPLIVPAGVSVKYEDVAADIASTSVCIEDVNVFSELISPPEPYEPVFDSIWSNLWSKDDELWIQ